MGNREHSKQGTVPIVQWGRRNSLKPSHASKLASRGLLDQFRPKGAAGKVVPKSGISDVEGADRWLRQWKAQQAGRRPRGLAAGTAAKAAADQRRRDERRAATLEQAVQAGVGELDRSHPDSGEDMQAANDRRAQMEADRVELQVAEMRKVLCVRKDLLGLVADCWMRLCRQVEAVPRLTCDEVIVAVQGGGGKVTREQREAVQSVLEDALEQRLRATQDELVQMFQKSGESGA